MVERRAHRDRVGVVAVVHEDDPVAELQALAPEAGESYARSAVGHLRRAARPARRRPRSRPGRWSGCGPRRRGSGRAAPRPASRPGPRSRPRRPARSTRLDVAARAEAEQPPAPVRGAARARPPRPGPRRCRRAAAPPSSSALAAAIASTEPSSSTWTGPTLVITPTSGSAIARQLGDLARPAHRHLQHQQVGVLGRLEHGQRQPDLGVEVLAVGVDAAGQQRPGDVLDRGLADRAGDADDAGAERPPPGARQRLQRRPAGRRPRRPRRRPRCGRLASASGTNCDISGRDDDAPGAGVDRRRGELAAVARSRRAGRRRGRRRPVAAESIVARARRASGAPSATTSAPSAAAISAGVEPHAGAAAASAAPRGRPRGRRRGPCGRPRTPGPARGPCRRSRPCRRARPARAPGRSPRGGRRSTSSSSAAAAPPATSATIASGSSERGLSEVTTPGRRARRRPAPSSAACRGRGRRRRRRPRSAGPR